MQNMWFWIEMLKPMHWCIAMIMNPDVSFSYLNFRSFYFWGCSLYAALLQLLASFGLAFSTESHFRAKSPIRLYGTCLYVEETGSEKCESHWSGVENWLQQQDRCWAAVCPRFGLVPSVILGATTPAFSYIPILDLNSYLIVHDHVQHNDSLG